jgi:hypothetical protein
VILPDERRVPVGGETRPETLDGCLGRNEEATAKGHRTAQEPTLLHDQDIVEVAPKHRFERKQLVPARGFLGDSAGPEGHEALLDFSVSRGSAAESVSGEIWRHRSALGSASSGIRVRTRARTAAKPPDA